MLVFALKDLPVLPKGKGNKIIAIPAQRARERKELLMQMTLVPEGASLTVYAGKRHFRLLPGHLADFRGERGRRGRKLPWGLRNVTSVKVEIPAQKGLNL